MEGYKPLEIKNKKTKICTNLIKTARTPLQSCFPSRTLREPTTNRDSFTQRDNPRANPTPEGKERGAGGAGGAQGRSPRYHLVGLGGVDPIQDPLHRVQLGVQLLDAPLRPPLRLEAPQGLPGHRNTTQRAQIGFTHSSERFSPPLGLFPLW